MNSWDVLGGGLATLSIRLPWEHGRGVACYPRDANALEDLLDVADKSLYAAKAKNGGARDASRSTAARPSGNAGQDAKRNRAA